MEAINPHDMVGETFIGVSNTAPVGRKVVDDYLRRSGIDIKPDHEADHLAMAPIETIGVKRARRGRRLGNCTHPPPSIPS